MGGAPPFSARAPAVLPARAMGASDRRSLLRSALRAGALLGAAKIAILVIAHLAFGVAALVSIATGVVLWAATIGALVVAALRLHRESGTFQPYPRALFHLCATWAVGQLLYTAFSILLFHVIEPGLLEATVEPMREIARKASEGTGMAAEQVDALVASITKETSPFSIAGQLRGYRDGLLPGIVLSALIAFPFRGSPSDATAT